MQDEKVYLGTGRRKTSVARVRLFEGGQGEIEVNGKPFDEYFPLDTYQRHAMTPLITIDKLKSMNVKARLSGGGLSAQSQALRHGITRAILQYNPELKPKLKELGLTTRDPRMKERKKYGKAGARKSFQFSKR